MQKTRIVFIVLFFCLSLPLAAQNVFIINKDTLQLKREVKGPLSLFWTRQDLEYRYFVQKGKRMLELVNPDGNGKFREQLSELTTDAKIHTRDVKFVLYSLRHFTNTYNALVQEDYVKNESTRNILQRISIFTGLSNNIYTDNPENILAPVLGFEYEFYDPNLAPRHSAFLQLRHNFEQDEYRYNATHLSVNYRFKALYFKKFDLHIDARLATLYYSSETVSVKNDAGKVVSVKDESGFTFTAPLSFGIGSDIKITPNSFLTVGYNDIFSLVLDSNGNFPIDFTLGYKYSL
ncbi:hypothetical protein JRG66_09000 [Salinimicrobium tongyeongense]|uniref:DUF481 domain-containing protein n=1 Tax=Salinimicrobium tongyeongense TaxID=2809707 RepID=A0ABY6NMM8_9FLAO|nr:hypothetical protein [Salinimicrobium tongyeongense]UZH54137.1 hypothetical protein JRG66_09000 [Salinimicrobium tongyeongense]